MSKTEVQKAASSALPAYLQGGKSTSIGNIDKSDLVIPRVKLLQAQSPEVMDGLDGARPGVFWHGIASESMGAELLGIPIVLRKSYVLWSPRDDDRGMLARANDGLNWDQEAGTKFEVKLKNVQHPITYVIGKTVHERTGDGPALSEFGSSIPGDPKSPPAAALTYNLLWYFPELEELSPAIIINTRSSVKPAQQLLSKIDLRPVDHFAQLYKIGIIKQPADEGFFFNYTYTSAGYADEDTYNITKGLYEKFHEEDWVASEEEADTDVTEGGAGPRRSTKSKEEVDGVKSF